MKNTKTIKGKVITLIIVAALVLSIGTISAFAAASASRIDPARLTITESGARIYNNMDEHGAIDLTDAELQELYDLMKIRDENGNVIEHVCTDECKDGHPLDLTVYHFGE